MRRTNEEEKDAIDKALDEFINDCRARLYEMVDRGKRNWDNPDISPDEDIARPLVCDAMDARLGDRLHLHDIANRAMMLWWRKWKLCRNTEQETKKDIDGLIAQWNAEVEKEAATLMAKNGMPPSEASTQAEAIVRTKRLKKS